MYVCMSVCLYVCTSARLYVCMSVCLNVCNYVRTYVCMYVCLFVYIYIYIYWEWFWVMILQYLPCLNSRHYTEAYKRNAQVKSLQHCTISEIEPHYKKMHNMATSHIYLYTLCHVCISIYSYTYVYTHMDTN